LVISFFMHKSDITGLNITIRGIANDFAAKLPQWIFIQLIIFFGIGFLKSFVDIFYFQIALSI
jgi:hypothetical protein